MTWWEGLLLGVVQGLTEFLPVSSSGHLVLAEAALGLPSPGVVLEVVLHVATLLAVVWVYRIRIWSLMRGAVGGDRAAWLYIGLLALATVPAALIGLLLEETIERAFDSLIVVGVGLLITGGLLWSTTGVVDRTSRQRPAATGALAIGAAQALALMPGISRSGSTITAAVWLGVKPVQAAEFSFLMAIPAVAGAGVLQARHIATDLARMGTGPLFVGFVASLVCGILAITFLVALLERRAFHSFAPYCWLLGTATLLWAFLTG